MQNRREFLAVSLGSLLAAKADAAPDHAPGEWRNRHSGMAYRRLGRTGYHISEVIMGGNTIAPDNYEHVLRALDMGLNYLDTAPAYGGGRSEEGYALVLKARGRDAVFLNSKISAWDNNRNKLFRDIFDSLPPSEQASLRAAAREEVERRRADATGYYFDYFNGQHKELEAATLSNAMEKKYGRSIDRDKNYKQLILDSVDNSLRRLGTDHLDLVMCPHGANTPAELLEFPEIFEAFEILKKSGKARHLGVSAHTDPAGIIEAAVQAKVYSVAMVAYNFVNHPRVDAAIEKAREHDLGVIAMKVARPLHAGPNGRGRAPDPARLAELEKAVPGPLNVPQRAYLWALRNPHVSAVNSEMITAAMVEDNVPLARSKNS